MMGSRSAYTRTRILDAAGRLFAKKGHENTSLREITAEAEVNLSAVNYHFGSKEGLVQAVYQQQLDALNRERLSHLERLEAQACGAPIEPASIVEAFFGPLVQHAARHSAARKSSLPMLDRPVSDSDVLLRTLFTDGHADTLDRFRTALLKALPELPEQEIYWRFQFMLGACSCAVTGMDGLLLAVRREDVEPFDARRLSERLMSFLTAGLLAPVADRSLEPAMAFDRFDTPANLSVPGT